ncbi:MAG: DUF4160 domain-containing protein [Oscillospiraceae bacterium]|nr:DUF4160 domain-containing protein [Oscillospiraceae bacterium]
MPTICMFYGILIKMYNEKGTKHNIPHFHAEYGEFEVVMDFDGNVIEGSLPKGKLRLVKAWTELHRDDLIANWGLLSNGEQFFRIPPLQ